MISESDGCAGRPGELKETQLRRVRWGLGGGRRSDGGLYMSAQSYRRFMAEYFFPLSQPDKESP